MASPPLTQRITEGIADVFVHQRWIPALIIIACTTIAALGLSGKTFEDRLGESDTAMPLDENRALLTEVRDQFGLEQLECFVVFDGKSVFTKSNIQAMLAAKEALAQLPQVASVVWLDDLPTLNLFGLTEPLLPETNASEAEYAASRERVLENPLVLGQLISEDGTTALMPLRYNWLQYQNADNITTDLVATVEKVLAKYPDCDLRVRLTGNAPLFQAIERAFSTNRLRFQIIGYVLVFFLSVVLFRGWRAVLIVGSAPMLGIF
ncbi:MAG: MMPL family transporter, partial [Planctomycetaceae bacterium]|nr:MMPL family transporter [Planctomycetaceae bacterium]